MVAKAPFIPISSRAEKINILPIYHPHGPIDVPLFILLHFFGLTGFFFWGMRELPVESTSASLTKPASPVE